MRGSRSRLIDDRTLYSASVTLRPLQPSATELWCRLQPQEAPAPGRPSVGTFRAKAGTKSTTTRQVKH
eukprot:6263992-Prymnesium_polylepis.2